jgi:hypothetical protein
LLWSLEKGVKKWNLIVKNVEVVVSELVMFILVYMKY